ncbi:MAG: 2-oxoglutarate dehydrogenase E1 component [Breznakibacter sp.]|nr:2-oxoglutarate dehydrogenase E1 component [Breznakibacter sp.]
MDKFSFVGNSEIEAIEALYLKYKSNPEDVDESFRNFFKGFDFARKSYSIDAAVGEQVNKEFQVINLIQGYRQRGHLFTKTNPVRQRRKYFPTLDIENFGLEQADLETVFQAGNEIGIGPAKLSVILDHLHATYCGSVAVEYLYMRTPELVTWLRTRMESVKNTMVISNDRKLHIYEKLVQAAGFESFIHRKFVGQKRFSLEGSEVIIPGLDALIKKGSELGVEEFVFGMAHRGRLNVLTNTLEKPYRNIFKEFVGGEYEDGISLGDVKYHLGYNNKIVLESGKSVKLHLAPNPSHLETVMPVIEGIAKSKLNKKYNNDFTKVLPIVIHGDAAIAAQGVVYEVVQMAQLPGYKTGGTLHIVINNQVGFTTNYLEARSSTYCTDIAKVTRSPVFHVNGDDAEAMIYTLELAMEYRQRFESDVFIDILSYRKHGHNEGDEPRFTQPTLYKIISSHPNPRDIYGQRLIKEGVATAEMLAAIQEGFENKLEEELLASTKIDKVYIQRFLNEVWSNYKYAEASDVLKRVDTTFPKDKLLYLAERVNHLPEDKSFINKVYKIIEDRKHLIASDKVDWAMAELLAYASLLTSGVPVRLSGQDAERGTFAHRHAAFTVEDLDEKVKPLQNLDSNQAKFEVINSLLSEYGVLGFEYGYALATPFGLTIWEAQFGDFSNVAQVIFDQYICSAEEKWGLMNGLVMLLPHGFEGQGPEHSSARMERYLSSAVRNNIQVVNITTPANYFHLLRRQVLRDFRLPLIVFSPKSMLRHPLCISSVDELSSGHFQEVIDDHDVEVENVKRVVLCTGKIYYDLLKRKTELDAKDIALVRVEQLHPFPKPALDAIFNKYKNSLLHLWVQEEPKNMGAWYYMQKEAPEYNLVPVARLSSASPATGLAGLHNIGQTEIIDKVFKPCHCDLQLKYCGLKCVEGKSHEEVLKTHRNIGKSTRFSI